MSEKQAILILTHVFPSPATTPHSGTFVVGQVQALQEKYNPILLVPYSAGLRGVRARLGVKTIDGLSVYYLPYWLPALLLDSAVKQLITHPFATVWQFITQPKNTLRLWWKLGLRSPICRAAAELNRQHHFKLVHGQEVMVGDEAAIVGKELSIPSIVTVHALFQFHCQSFGGLVMSEIITNLNQADQLVTVSQLAARSYLHIVNKPFLVVPNGLKSLPTASLSGKIKNLIKNKSVILYVGFLVYSKRVDILLKSLRQLKQRGLTDFLCLIVGKGPAEPDFQALVREYDLTQEVVFVGEIDPALLSAYYEQAAVLVQPSESDSFSMVCLEAMSVGLPVITTDQTGISEYVTANEEAIVIPSGDSNLLSHYLNKLLTDSEYHKKLATASKKASQRFAWPTVIKPLIKCYDDLISK